MWDSTPWFVGGGAQHSPEVARLLSYAATGGAEGIITPGDLKVIPLDVAGTSVRVLPGACLVLSRSAGGAQQTYVGRNPSEDPVAIAATGSSGGRIDLIVARVEDPFMPGEPWADPADVTVGPYIFSRVIPNVPSSAIVSNAAATNYIASLGYSAIPLAAVSLPANTGTVDGTMVKDLRKMARPRIWHEFDVQFGADVGGQPDYVLVTETNWHNWPPNHSLTVEVPKWATYAQISIQLNGISADGPADVDTRIQLGSRIGPTNYFDYNGNTGTAAGFVETKTHFTFAEFDVQALQGTSQTLRLNARRAFADLNTGQVWFGAGQQIIFDIRFRESAV